LALWPAGLTLPRTRRTLYLGLTLLGVSAIGSLLLEGVWASGEALRTMWLAPRSLDTHSRKFDTLYAFRSYLLVIFGVLLVCAVSTQRKADARALVAATKRSHQGKNGTPDTRPLLPSWVLPAGTVVVTLLLMVTWTLAGHSATGLQTPLAIVANLLHLSAMTIWLGGLAVLLISLRPAAHAADLTAVLPRFSRVAFACVVVLVATGSYQAWREVGTVPALYRTTFGRVLLVKIVAVLAVIAMGALARRWVQAHLNQPPEPSGAPSPTPPLAKVRRLGSTTTLERASTAPPDGDSLSVRGLQRGLLVEVVIALVVLGLTAALVVTVPARQSYVRPFGQSLTAPGLQVSVRIDAPRPGDAVLHLTTRSSTGASLPVTGLRGTLSLPDAGLGPLPLRLPNATGSASTGREDIGLTFARGGRWVLALTVQTSPFDATAFSFTVPVR
ncbi:MAG: copper resistance protein CopC, partial [Pseudonocardiales bacterium]|nr:copper resistance protein CopC [Pseudonocardiales bacterium]